MKLWDGEILSIYKKGETITSNNTMTVLDIAKKSLEKLKSYGVKLNTAEREEASQWLETQINELVKSKPRYEYSKDYDVLYEKVCTGFEPLCLVDYDFIPKTGKPSRDVCRIRRFDEFDIIIGARGIQYGGVGRWHQKGKITERELFVTACKELNLEWVV